MSKVKFLKINPLDNVAVALEDLPKGFIADGVRLNENIPRGHKYSLTTIADKTPVIKYGYPIGIAKTDIKPGCWVHSQNLKSGLGGLEEYNYNPQLPPSPTVKESCFNGYQRSDGEVGIRNELWIIPTVGCVNKTAELLARDYKITAPGVDGVFVFTHPYGCSQLGEDHETTQHILANLVHHPNAGGVLVLGLGCENNTPESFKKVIGETDPKRVKFMVAQEVSDEIVKGKAILKELEEYAAQTKRTPCPLSKLRVGLKCGGSDGFSGITANPLVGSFSDMLIAYGGTSVLTEVPEMFGAETILMERCRTKKIFDKCVDMVNGFKEYFIRHNQVVYENPSPGNKEGGITTLEEKSLGCIQKGGTGIVEDVLDHTERLKHSGLNLLSGPGNDIVAVTALAAAGAHMILFTTGRGTPLGGPAPTLKISTNNELAKFKKNWIDFNAGTLLTGETMPEATQRLMQKVIDTANGEATCSERNGYREIAIFKDGVTL